MPVLRRSALALVSAILALALGGSSAPAQPWKASVLALPEATAVAADSARPAPADATTPRRSPVGARRRSQPSGQAADANRRQPTILAPIVVGALGAVLGAVGGVAIGAGQDHASDDIPAGAVTGFVVGEALGLPLGVHVGNGGRGNILGDLGASVVGGVCAIGLGSAFNDAGGYLLGIGAQLALTVWTERRVAAHKARAQAAPADTTRHMTSMPLPPPEPEPLLPPPLPTK